ncbi:MAG TPA: hypothetical protein VHU91_00750 [Mycobacteriales bacterium]|jgi:hypothetical protein|nr:hypothetical protein [Mycobacteriales bacterium]
MNRDIVDSMAVRIIATYTNTKHLIELLQREYTEDFHTLYFTPELSPHPGHGTTYLIINFFQPRDGDTA